MKVTANQPFYGKGDEHMWLVNDTREVSEERAAELKKAGLVSDPDEAGAALAAQNKALDAAADKAAADKHKKLLADAKKADDAAKLDKARREKEAKDAAEKVAKEAAELAEKEAKEVAERRTKEEKEAAERLTKDEA
jgi:colicin import membrane protein